MPSRPAEFTISSIVEGSAAAVWERIITPAGINHEMGPWLRMTVPRGLDRLEPGSIELGRPIGRSWILLFGVVPIDYDLLCLERLEEGRAFLERSTMLSMRVWEHERTVEPLVPSRSRVTDRVRFEPRLGLPGAAIRPALRAFFGHRHRRLGGFFAARGRMGR